MIVGSQMLVTIVDWGPNRRYYLKKRPSIARQTRECLVRIDYVEFVDDG